MYDRDPTDTVVETYDLSQSQNVDRPKSANFTVTLSTSSFFSKILALQKKDQNEKVHDNLKIRFDVTVYNFNVV